MSGRDDQSSHEDRALEALLARVGARIEPPPEIADEVRRAVHAAWRSTVEVRAIRRRKTMYAVAASLAFVLVVAAAALRWTISAPATVATVALIQGSLRGEDGAARSAGDAVREGEVLHTGPDGRAALAMGQSLSVRLDRNSVVEMAATDRLLLRSGAVYVDAPMGGDELVIETRSGAVRHIGTQYQVRVRERAIEISVREGKVAASLAGGADAVGVAGERLTVSDAGAVDRTRIAPNAPAWEWAAQAAPPFDIDNRSLAALVAWVARETGRSVQYASDDARRAAEALMLRGSIAGLAPDEALNAALSTTRFIRYRTKDDVIGIALASQR